MLEQREDEAGVGEHRWRHFGRRKMVGAAFARPLLGCCGTPGFTGLVRCRRMGVACAGTRRVLAQRSLTRILPGCNGGLERGPKMPTQPIAVANGKPRRR